MNQRNRIEIEYFLMRTGLDAGGNTIAFTGAAIGLQGATGIVAGGFMPCLIAAVTAF